MGKVPEKTRNTDSLGRWSVFRCFSAGSKGLSPDTTRPGSPSTPSVQCELELCGEVGSTAVNHGRRPEPVTVLCDYHADRALGVDGTVIVERGETA